jgi:hypothetical protein
MTNSGLKVNRIKAANAGTLGLLGATLAPGALGRAAEGKLTLTRTNVVEKRNMAQAVSQLGRFVRADGFDPTRTFQYVANIDTEVWALVQSMFARYNDDGELMDDGLLYKTDGDGNVKMNKDFFYAIIEYLEASGYPCDMRGKIKVN